MTRYNYGDPLPQFAVKTNDHMVMERDLKEKEFALYKGDSIYQKIFHGILLHVGYAGKKGIIIRNRR